MKKIYLIHGWAGGPEKIWFPWLREELTKQNFEVIIPKMPETNVPVVKSWVEKLEEIVGTPDNNTFFIGHSIGCQAILRFLEKQENPVGGAVFVAGWFDLRCLPSIEAESIAKPWLNTEINFNKINRVLPKEKAVLIISDNDPYGCFDYNRNQFSKLVNKEIILPKAEHISMLHMPEILTTLLSIETV